MPNKRISKKIAKKKAGKSITEVFRDMKPRKNKAGKKAVLFKESQMNEFEGNVGDFIQKTV